MIISHSARETEEFGAQFACELKSGDVVALEGQLGSGKTHLVKGIARGLGITTEVTSPTFTLLHEYEGGRLPLYHFDFYRLRNEEELPALGFDEYVFGRGITVIEWADRFPGVLPPQTRLVRLRSDDGTKRQISVD